MSLTAHPYPSQTLKIPQARIPTCILECPKLGGDNFPEETKIYSNLAFLFFNPNVSTYNLVNLLFTLSNDFDSHTKALCKVTKCQLL